MNKDITIKLPDNVKFIIGELEKNGFEAYAVGGCVRDSLLGREPEDWDITTIAKPEEVKAIFKKTIDTGIQHGTVTVMLEGTGYEVTTYRIDGEYEDGRHPTQVQFTPSLTEDLRRRDFTINAMAYSDTGGIVDVFGGIEDMEKHIIRCVGSAVERFSEDALRILRAYRFSAQLGFDIDEETIAAATERAETLSLISAERVRVEISKLLMSSNPDRLIWAYEAGITKVILPEFDEMMKTSQENENHIYNVGEHTIKAVEWLDRQCQDEKQLDKKIRLALRFTMLLHDCAKPECKNTDENGTAHFYGHDVKGEAKAKEILKRLKFDNDTIEVVSRLVRYHDCRFNNIRHGLTAAGMRYITNKAGSDIMKLLFIVERADVNAQSPDGLAEKLEIIDRAEILYDEMIAAKECFSLKSLAVNGRDLIMAGVTPGPWLGEILNRLLEHVIENPDDNNKDFLTGMALKLRIEE